MLISYMVSDVPSIVYLINTFSNVVEDYDIIRNPLTGEIEILTLIIKNGKEKEAGELKELIEISVTEPSKRKTCRNKKRKLKWYLML